MSLQEDRMKIIVSTLLLLSSMSWAAMRILISVQAPPPVNSNTCTNLISNHAMAMQLDRTMNVLGSGMVMDVREFI